MIHFYLTPWSIFRFGKHVWNARAWETCLECLRVCDWNVWDHPSISSSPSQTILPTRRHKWRSEMRSISNLSNLNIRSLIKLAFSSVSFLLRSLSAFKSCRRNSINTSFPIDILFLSEPSFGSFLFSLVTIHKPPIHSFLFNFQKVSHIFNFLQCRPLTYIVVIALQQCPIRLTQRCSLRLFCGNAMDVPEVIVKKHFPMVHTSTDVTHVASLTLHIWISVGSWHNLLNIWTSLLWRAFAIRRGAELCCPDRLSDTRIRQASLRQLGNDIFSIHQG